MPDIDYNGGQIFNYSKSLTDHRTERMISQYKSFTSEIDRLNWILDVDHALDTLPNRDDSPEEENLNKIKEDFFNPQKPDGSPDHEKFAQRMDAYNHVRMECNLLKGHDAINQMSSGLFNQDDPNFRAKCAYVGSMGPAGKRTEHLTSIYMVSVSSDYYEPYAQRMLGPAKKGENVHERYSQAVKKGINDLEVPFVDRLNAADKEAWQLSKEAEEKGFKELFSNAEMDKIDAYNASRVRQDNENRAFRSNIVDPEADFKDAMAQFNSKRSIFFFGKETDEHKALRLAGDDYQEKLKSYKDARNADPVARLEAINALQEAAQKMQTASEKYQTEKGGARTGAGIDRLAGAKNLHNLAEQMQAQLGKERKALEQSIEKQHPGYTKLKNDLKTAQEAEGKIPLNSMPDRQLRSAIACIEFKEIDHLHGGLDHDNPNINKVNTKEAAVAQVIALQSLYNSAPEKYTKWGVDKTQLSYETDRILENPGFKKMMENYDRKPGSLTALARNNPNQLWQEMIKTEQQLNLGRSGNMLPRNPEGPEAYPKETAKQINARGHKIDNKKKVDIKELQKKDAKKTPKKEKPQREPKPEKQKTSTKTAPTTGGRKK